MNDIPISKIYVINLKKDTERLAKVSANLAGHGLKFERVDACLGKSLGLQPREEWAGWLGARILPKPLLGCGISHISTWERVVKLGLPNALILEDDARLVKGFKRKVIKLMKKIPPTYDIIFFGRNGVREDGGDFYSSVASFLRPGKYNNVKQWADGIVIPGFVCGFHGYLISHKGAVKLLQLNRRVETHIDMQVSGQLKEHLVAFASKKPLIFGDTESNNTTLGSRFPHSLNWLVSGKKIEDTSWNWLLGEPLYNIGGADIRGWNLAFFIASSSLGCLFGKEVGIGWLIVLGLFLIMDLELNGSDGEVMTMRGDYLSACLGLILGTQIRSSLRSMMKWNHGSQGLMPKRAPKE